MSLAGQCGILEKHGTCWSVWNSRETWHLLVSVESSQEKLYVTCVDWCVWIRSWRKGLVSVDQILKGLVHVDQILKEGTGEWIRSWRKGLVNVDQILKDWCMWIRSWRTGACGSDPERRDWWVDQILKEGTGECGSWKVMLCILTGPLKEGTSPLSCLCFTSWWNTFPAMCLMEHLSRNMPNGTPA